MTDVHTHLLPAVDDGVKTLKEALCLMEYMQEIGVRRVFLTPHITDEYPSNTPEYLRERYGQLKSVTPAGLELCLGAEYMLDTGFRKQFSSGLLALPGNYVLVETSYLAAPLDLLNLLFDLSLEGYTPLIAHPERYMYMVNPDYFLLRNKGYKFQLNLFSLAGFYGEKVRKNARFLLKNGFYDFVGTDCHDSTFYRNALHYLSLSRREIEALSPLIENNKLI